jgi:hypothetical protein
MLTRRMKLGLSMTGFFAAAAMVVSVIFCSNGACAKEPLGKAWPAGQYISMDDVDHAVYDQLLQTYVNGDGMVNYAAWRGSDTDRKSLQNYLLRLSQASPSVKASGAGQLAFWINAYNATTIEGILQVYPTSSIRNHTAKVAGYNLWKDLPLLVGGKPHSLDAMEHQVLRKMGEPRIHFAIVCASIGCPRLLNEAYTPDRIEEQLAMNTRDFFSRSQNFQVDKSGVMHVSSILDWFGEDFGPTQQAQLLLCNNTFLRTLSVWQSNPHTRLVFQDYDWSLNEQRRARTTGNSTKSGSGKR